MNNVRQFHKNERIRLAVTDMGNSGEGIGRIPAEVDSPVFFIKNAVIGDDVLAVITKMKKGYGYAKVLQILNPSPHRVKPVCPLAERCGGCQTMQLSYDAQLHFKEEKVRNDLERIGGQQCEQFYPIIGMDCEQPVHFRNKMQFPVGWDKEGHVVTGFYAGRTHYIIAAPDCPVAADPVCSVTAAVRQFLENHRISTYREETGRGLVRHILIRTGFYTGQIMVCLVINGDCLMSEEYDGGLCNETEKLQQDGCCTHMEDKFAGCLKSLSLPDPWRIQSICLNTNTEDTNVILGHKTRCLYGTPFILDRIVSSQEDVQPLQFQISPRSFFQTNPLQTGKLYDTVLEFSSLTGRENVWDLYCGIGTISLFLAQKAGKVYGVEIVREAVEDARENAAKNGISNAAFIHGKAEEVLRPEAAADVVVLDPPRKGCAPELLETISRALPPKIVYVSCDPATLARDVKTLCEYGYKLEKVQPVDMFPHTVHVECVCLLDKNSSKPKDYIEIDVDAEDYYRIKDSEKNE